MIQEVITYAIVAAAVVVSIRFLFGIGRRKPQCSCGCGSTAAGRRKTATDMRQDKSACPSCRGKSCPSPTVSDSEMCRSCTLQGLCHHRQQ
ncbi:MAG: hypothetical protein IJ154_08935 [Bacteroidales bacterium]|nr:hypothetical protein [Bacteroidales bacterium]